MVNVVMYLLASEEVLLGVNSTAKLIEINNMMKHNSLCSNCLPILCFQLIFFHPCQTNPRVEQRNLPPNTVLTSKLNLNTAKIQIKNSRFIQNKNNFFRKKDS